ncbi:MAG: PH domain-containing protein [Mycobacteriales bacterium]|nr:PH domain-containing protein [Mycobacteriales bacterium]
MSDWSRLHPLTPLLRGGRYLLALIAVVGQQGLRSADGRFIAVAAGVGTPLALLAGYLSWRTTRYRVEGSELHITSGVLQKRDRRVPLPRVQSIDVVRPLVGRVLGLAELRLEVVGGGDTEARLSYLTDDQAVALRGSLLALVSGTPEADEQPTEHVLVEVPTEALVGSVLRSPATVLLVSLPVIAALTALVDVRAAGTVLLGLLPALLGTGSLAVRRLLLEYGFSVAEVPGGLRLRHGLLDKRTQTIPTGRVQTVRVREPLLWRRKGWVRVEVDVAGYAGGRGEEQAQTSALLPVAPRELALALVERVLGGPLPKALLPAPPSARWRAPLSARRLRIGSDRRLVVSRYGILTSTTDVVPLSKVQSLRLSSGPWQRRLGLASVHVDSAGRSLREAVLQHRGAGEADELITVLTARARAARQPTG